MLAVVNQFPVAPVDEVGGGAQIGSRIQAVVARVTCVVHVPDTVDLNERRVAHVAGAKKDARKPLFVFVPRPGASIGRGLQAHLAKPFRTGQMQIVGRSRITDIRSAVEHIKLIVVENNERRHKLFTIPAVEAFACGAVGADHLAGLFPAFLFEGIGFPMIDHAADRCVANAGPQVPFFIQPLENVMIHTFLRILASGSQRGEVGVRADHPRRAIEHG